jgi:hypothetical protein
MTEQSKDFVEGLTDPLGPGEPAWDASEQAIIHGINGRPEESKKKIDEMVRHLIAHNQDANVIRQWETFIAERIANPEPDDFD